MMFGGPNDTEEPSYIICLQNKDGSLNKAAVRHIKHQRAWAELKKEVAKLPQNGGQ